MYVNVVFVIRCSYRAVSIWLWLENSSLYELFIIIIISTIKQPQQSRAGLNWDKVSADRDESNYVHLLKILELGLIRDQKTVSKHGT